MLNEVDFAKVLKALDKDEDAYPEALARAVRAVADADDTIISAFQSYAQ